MCGVVSIIYSGHNDNLGKEACFLLKKLEYRGYDSTGGAFIKKDGAIVLKKKVGAPSRVVVELEMNKMSGYKFIGQVRWATYGAVTDDNAQPHEVECHTHLVGAHNGNISNTDFLKEFLRENGHRTVSDNDGEMLVHLIEHYYSKYLKRLNPGDREDEKVRIATFIQAIRKAGQRAEGSYAACITAPDIEGVFAIKSGSSLYAGKGRDTNGDFIVVSSDLTSVLSKTRFLVPISEGEGLYFTSTAYNVFSLKEDKEYVPELKRSRLNISDISLAQKYHYFMEQEIYTSPQNIDMLIKYYFADKEEEKFFAIFEKNKEECKKLLDAFLKLYGVFDHHMVKTEFENIRKSETFSALYNEVILEHKRSHKEFQSVGFTSEEAALLDEIMGLDEQYFPELFILDRMLIWKKKRKTLKLRSELSDSFKKIQVKGGRVFVVASGTSYHAALVGAYIFNNLNELSLIPANPGTFRSMYMNTITARDMVMGVSQSGETKDLVDIFNDLRARHGHNITLASIVNNENSTLPQEKSDFYLPLMCGPEIAVAATKSFISQLALFYILASGMKSSDTDIKNKLEKIKYYMTFTLRAVDLDVTEVALKTFLKPSIHILGTSLVGLSREGALKIREVVLNHTEGYDSAEFKHGPNTILGKNTIYSLNDMERLHSDLIESFEEIIQDKEIKDITEFLSLLKNYKLQKVDGDIFFGTYPVNGDRDKLNNAFEHYRKRVNIENYFTNYPLVFICPPDERDKRITVTQIHTHKIRGADVILIAEDSDELKRAIEGKPAGLDNYYSKYIMVPKTGDKNIFLFEAALVLQLLALRMSIAKMKYMNMNQVENHGVHPDVPKNVSKSITVD
ncbi:MAG: SIS domain-containing protein [Acidobacteria bacterium]|jgi:glucosamine 6-phosphate synthetase-like amidotransferase/phosphosugar isomerase protein|nr:SIS domain-containing protein [Acidobacteriota bacterium]